MKKVMNGNGWTWVMAHGAALGRRIASLAWIGLIVLGAASASAATYYWDTNGATAGFGMAGGTWAVPTISRWSLSTAGTGTPGASITTATTDILNFGNGATGLGSGTITVSGSVSAGNMTFASGSGAITLTGGTSITLPAAATITVNNFTDTISSALVGIGSLTKDGSGKLKLSCANTYSGGTRVKCGNLEVFGNGTLGSGNVTVEAGILKLYTSTTISDSARLTIMSGARVDLAFTGNEHVKELSLDGMIVSAGVWGAENAPAYFTGTGKLVVGLQPQALSIANTGYTTIYGGTTKAYMCTALYVNGTSKIVSTEATAWSIVGSAPVGTYFVGNNLVCGAVNANTFITVKATYTSGGVTVSATKQITILPGLTVTAEKTSSDATTVVGSWIFCKANVAGNSGPPIYVWSFPGASETFATNSQTPQVKYPKTGSYVATVTVKDQTSTCVNMLQITLNCPPVTDEPDVQPAFTGLPGLVDLSLYSESRKANGLVVIVHGINSGETPTAPGGWMRAMGDSIINRVSPSPNVVLYDWHSVADFDQITDLPVSSLTAAKISTIRLLGELQGRYLGQWIKKEAAANRIDLSRDIQLIGHSAGCFVVGDCAAILKEKVTQATMLDPIFLGCLPIMEYLTFGGRMETYMVSPFALVFPGNYEIFTALGPAYMLGILDKAYCYLGVVSDGKLENKFSTLDIVLPNIDVLDSVKYSVKLHNWTHDWYTTNTVLQTPPTINGFYYSPFNDNGFHGPPKLRINALSPRQSPVTLSGIMGVVTQQLSGVSTFGNVVITNNSYKLTESANAGVFKIQAIPVDAKALVFRYRYLTVGDGDFLSVHWGTNDVLYVGENTALDTGEFIDAKIYLGALRGQTDLLTFKLVSRGATNAVIELEGIGITLSNDSDNDGLTNDEESALGTDPLKADTDDDGLLDYDEVNTYHTNPLLKHSDNDGMDDGKEIICGTNPNDKSDVFAITDISYMPGIGTQIRWPSVAGKLYDLLRWTNLTENAYSTVGCGISATTPTNTVIDTESSPGACFYWLRIAE